MRYTLLTLLLLFLAGCATEASTPDVEASTPDVETPLRTVAVTIDDLAQMMVRRGYTFITLEDALRDEAYSLGDPYTGSSGISWLQRWAIGRGETRRDEPPVDAFIREISGF